MANESDSNPEPESYTALYMGGSKKPARRKNINNNIAKDKDMEKDKQDTDKETTDKETENDAKDNNPGTVDKKDTNSGTVDKFSEKPRTVVSVSPDDTPPAMSFSDKESVDSVESDTTTHTEPKPPSEPTPPPKPKPTTQKKKKESKEAAQLSQIKAALMSKALTRKHKLNFFTFLVGFCAFAVAGCAAFFSVRGIALLFSGAVTGVLIMASSLEIAKLVTASFLYRYWRALSKLLRFYLVTAVVLLITITSLGIFGYLSDAFETTKTQVQLYEDKITKLEGDIELATKKSEILRSEKVDVDAKTDKAVEDYKAIYESFLSRKEKEKADVLARISELDAARDVVNSTSGGLFSSKKKKLKDLEEQQAPIRAELNTALSDIDSSIDTEYGKFMEKVNTYKDRLLVVTNASHSEDINTLDASIENKRMEILAAKEAINDTDIGSFKFIARAFGLELDTVVKYFIFILVIVFDPLAVTLVIAYNIALLRPPPSSKVTVS